MRAMKETISTSQRLVLAASELFARDGIHATGIAAIADHAGVSKMTLYAHFTSKDELIVAYLNQRDDIWNDAVRNTFATVKDPAQKLLCLFDLYREWLLRGGLRGCAFVNCAAEFPDRSHPVRLAIAQHKMSVKEHLLSLAQLAKVNNAEVVTQRLFLLLEGAFLTGALENDEDVFVVAKQLAAELIESAASRH